MSTKKEDGVEVGLEQLKQQLEDALEYGAQADKEIEQLKQQLDSDRSSFEFALKAVAGATTPGAPGQPVKRVRQPLAPEHRGTKTYVVGPQKAYKNGRMYAQGEHITVTDERPSRDWKLVGSKDIVPNSDQPTALVVPKPDARASDKNVGG